MRDGIKKSCRALPGTEIILNSLLAGLMQEDRMPAGSILDAGAFQGGTACYLASQAPGRAVHALEPVAFNFHLMNSTYGHVPNLFPMLAMLRGAGSSPDDDAAMRRTIAQQTAAGRPFQATWHIMLFC